jgi:hypothetical protein
MKLVYCIPVFFSEFLVTRIIFIERTSFYISKRLERAYPVPEIVRNQSQLSASGLKRYNLSEKKRSNVSVSHDSKILVVADFFREATARFNEVHSLTEAVGQQHDSDEW